MNQIKINPKDIIPDPCEGCPSKHKDDWGYCCDIWCGKRSEYLAMLKGAKMMLEYIKDNKDAG